MADAFPEIAKQWHPTKNGELPPQDVSPSARTRAWWKCVSGADHEWQTSVVARTRLGTGCPFCAGKRPCQENNLAVRHPEIAASWHPTKNGALTPADVLPGSDRQAWWRCARGHAWQTTIDARVRRGNCPQCRKKHGRVRAPARSDKRSGVWYLGVSLDGQTGRYVAAIAHHRRTHKVGRWPTAPEAAVARDRAALHLGLDVVLNCPEISKELGPLSPVKLRALARENLRKSKGITAPRGLRYDEAAGTWSASLGLAEKRYAVAGFLSEEQAAIAYDRMALYYRGPDFPRHFPRRKLHPASQATLRREVLIERRKRIYRCHPGSYGLYGVYFNPLAPQRPWLALMSTRRRTVRGRPGSPRRSPSQYLGSYETEREAAEAHDRAALYYFGSEYQYLNYPERAASLEPADAATLKADAFRLGKRTKSSQFRGVYYVRKTGAWAASIHYQDEQRYLGTFPSEEHAALAYDRAALRVWGRAAKPNFHPETGEPLGGLSLKQFETKQRVDPEGEANKPRRRPGHRT